MKSFNASVQYGDWRGTVQADDAHNTTIRSALKAKGVIKDGEFVVAIRLYGGESVSQTSPKPWVRAVIADGVGYDSVDAQISGTENLRFKEREVDMTWEEYFSLFKRYEVVLVNKGLGLEGRDYEIISE